MNPFVSSAFFACVSIAIFVTSSSPAVSQDRYNSVRHCLSIADVNQRVDCLESGAVPPPEASPASTDGPVVQQNPSPSFDCKAARTSIERAICGDPTLSSWDARMGQFFQQALRATKDRQSLLEDQRLWLTQRDSGCSALADNAVWSCLLDMTKARLATLAKVSIASADVAPSVQIYPGTLAPTSQGRPDTYSNSAISMASRATAPPASESNRVTESAPARDDSHVSTILFVALALAFIVTIVVRSHSRRKMRIAAEGQRIAEENRRLAEIQRLVARYGDDAAARILAHEVWQGMTWEELVESRGHPIDVGREIIRDRIRETWKYYQVGKNRFKERVYLENGIVIGWKI